jgi:hypothetical protein
MLVMGLAGSSMSLIRGGEGPDILIFQVALVDGDSWVIGVKECPLRGGTLEPGGRQDLDILYSLRLRQDNKMKIKSDTKVPAIYFSFCKKPG